MSEKIEHVIESVLMDGNDEFIDDKEGYISIEEYDKVLNEESLMIY